MNEMMNKGTKEISLVEALASYNVTVNAGSVESNISYIKEVMTAKQDAIKNTVYSGTREEQIAMMKEEKAAVNKFKDAVQKQRTDVKKKLLKSFEAFDSEAKEVIEIAQSTYSTLNTQVETLEEERRKEKRVKIREIYDERSTEVGDFADTLYNLIYKTEWENTSTSMKKITEEQQAAIDSYINGKNTLELTSCDQDIKDDALNRFQENLDFMAAMQYIANETKKRAEEAARREAEKARMEAEYQAKLEAEKKRIEEEARIAAEKKVREEAAAREAARIEAERKAHEEAAAREAETPAQAAATPTMNAAIKKPSFLDSNLTGSNAKQTQTRRICVEFFCDDWKTVQEYCTANQIFFNVKSGN